MAECLGFVAGQVVQEFYFDDDVDMAVRAAITQETGHEIVDDDYGDVVDGVLIWWRAEDAEEEDLEDVLVDAAANLDDDGGSIWVLTPKAGSDGAVDSGEVEEAARVAGLQATSSVRVGDNWAGMRMVSRARVR